MLTSKITFNDIKEKQQLESRSPEMKTGVLALNTSEIEDCLNSFNQSSLVYLCQQRLDVVSACSRDISC